MLLVFARPKVAAGWEVSDDGCEEHVPQKRLGGQGALVLIMLIPCVQLSLEQDKCKVRSACLRPWKSPQSHSVAQPSLLWNFLPFIQPSQVTLCSSSFPLILSLGDHTETSLPCTSEEQILASSGISLVEYHGIKSWREKGPQKLVQTSKANFLQSL